jgi:uncharacterized protein (DUF2461 family)
MEKFSRKTFQYFDEASENRNDLDWFEKNKSLYEDHVLAPMSFLIDFMDAKFGDQLEGIEVSPRKITRPKNPKNRAENGIIKDFTKVDIMEKKTSLFEWNPGFHIQFGSKEHEGIYFAGGMYMVTGRQIKEFRRAASMDYTNLKKIVNSRKFKKSWGQIEGERYKRFPRDYDADEAYAEFLWMRNFYFMKTPTRTQMIKKDFIPNIVQDFENSLEVLHWLRDAVGVYKK